MTSFSNFLYFSLSSRNYFLHSLKLMVLTFRFFLFIDIDLLLIATCEKHLIRTSLISRK